MNDIAAEIRVRGQVQGVGYRYFVYTRANALGLAGWVRNMPDGSVSLLVEGSRGLIDTLIQDLKVGPSAASVTDCEVRWTPFSGQFRRFEVVR